MTDTKERLLVDCSVVVKWKLADEPAAAQAGEMLRDWQSDAVVLCAPDQLATELMSAFLRAWRKQRISEAEADAAVRDLLALPLTRYETTRPVILRAYAIAKAHQQRAYDCVYVAIAERKRIQFWTGDQRLYNGLSTAFPHVRWIGDYRPRRS